MSEQLQFSNDRKNEKLSIPASGIKHADDLPIAFQSTDDDICVKDNHACEVRSSSLRMRR